MGSSGSYKDKGACRERKKLTNVTIYKTFSNSFNFFCKVLPKKKSSFPSINPMNKIFPEVKKRNARVGREIINTGAIHQTINSKEAKKYKKCLLHKEYTVT